MRLPRVLVSALLLLALPSVARAQSTDDEEDTKATRGGGKGKGKPKDKAASDLEKDMAPTGKDAEAGTATEMPEEPMPSYDASGDPAGATENPNSPATPWDRKATATVEQSARPAPAAYPIERIYRPLVLPRGMIEAAFDMPVTVSPGTASGVLRGTYSFDGRWQAGLRYGTGTFDSDKYHAGKTFSIDVEYLVFPWLSGQVSLPALVDPYSQGLILGAPMKWEFLDKFSIEILRDLVSFKLYRFAPSIGNAAANEAFVALDETNTDLPEGELNLGGRATYQFSPKLAGDANYAVRMPDFKQDGAPVELTLGASYSTSNRFDVAARLGFGDLGDAADTFILQLGVAFRI